MKYICLLAFAAVTAISCKKESGEPVIKPMPAPLEGNLKTSNFYYIDGSYYVKHYHYTDQGKLIRDEDKTAEGTLMSARTYDYNTAGQLSILSLRSAAAKVAEHVYSYNGHKLTKSEYKEYTDGGNLHTIFEQIFEYKEDRLQKVTLNHFNGPPSYYTILSWSGGNVTSQKRYEAGSDAPIDETIYEYDDKINPYYKLGMPSDGNPRYSSVNNVTKNITTTITTGATLQITAVFEYNTAGKPLRQDNRFSDGRKLHEQSYTYH